MPAKKLSLDPDVVLEFLLDRGLVEPTSSPIHPYRIATNEEDYMPHTITFLTNELSKAFSKNRIRATNKKVWRRELYKCLEEFQISYEDRATRANYHWEFEETAKKFLEQKLNIDLDAIHEYDRHHRHEHKGGTRYTSYWHQQLKRYGETKALEKFRKYFERRMQELSVDLRTKRLPKSEYDK